MGNDEASYPKLRHNLFSLLTKELTSQLGEGLTEGSANGGKVSSGLGSTPAHPSIVSAILSFYLCLDAQSIKTYLLDGLPVSLPPSLLQEGTLACMLKIVGVLGMGGEEGEADKLYRRMYEGLGENLLLLGQHSLLTRPRDLLSPGRMAGTGLPPESNYFI